MQGPDFLPDELKRYESLETDKELFGTLIHNLDDLLTFFEKGCEDEEWCLEHLVFMRSVMRWGAKYFYLGRLSHDYAKRLAQIIRDHALLLQPFLSFQAALFFTVKLEIEEEVVLVNSLLFGTSSPFFRDLFKSCFDELKGRRRLPAVPLPIFRLLEEFILKGSIAELWRQDYAELLLLMRQAKTWQLSGLVKDCAVILKRYINRDNVIATLLQAHRQFFTEWKEECCRFFNQQGYGLRFLPIDQDADLKVEIGDFKQDTLELFDELAPWLTHLALGGNLSKNRLHVDLVYRCPKLVGIDLSGSFDYEGHFYDLPRSLVELNLSACTWLRPSYLKEASQAFLNLKKLDLAGNSHLNYHSWGELVRFRQLLSLNLARCHQMTDEDLKLIAHSCPHLIECNLEECRGLSDKGIADLISACSQIRVLNLTRCQGLTDKMLGELGLRAYQLTHLSLIRCLNLTDSGIFQFLRWRSTLTYLNIQGCNLSLQAKERMRKEWPFLRLEE